MKLIGLTGAHGTGKTTLAAQAAGEFGWEFAKSDVSGVYKKLGLDPRVRMTLDQRLAVQKDILDYHFMQWLNLKKTCPADHIVITDRTPYCFMAFMLAEISGYDTLTPEQNEKVLAYVDQCKRDAEKFFEMVCYIPRAIPFVPATHKIQAVANEAYREHWDMLIQGILLARVPVRRWSSIQTVNMEDRLAELKAVVAAV